MNADKLRGIKITKNRETVCKEKIFIAVWMERKSDFTLWSFKWTKLLTTCDMSCWDTLYIIYILFVCKYKEKGIKN